MEKNTSWMDSRTEAGCGRRTCDCNIGGSRELMTFLKWEIFLLQVVLNLGFSFLFKSTFYYSHLS